MTVDFSVGGGRTDDGEPDKDSAMGGQTEPSQADGRASLPEDHPPVVEEDIMIVDSVEGSATRYIP